MNEEFKKISSTKTAKEAWTILKTTYEGTKAIKDSKLQRLTTSFEEIKMEEDESVNSTFNLGKPFSNSRLLERCSDLYQRDSMPRSRSLKNQTTLIKFL